MACEKKDLEPDELVKVLSRVAQLIDKQHKSDLLHMLEDDSGRIPLDVCRSHAYGPCISKGALVAEVVYLELTGDVRNRERWYLDDELVE